jgi:mercuric transport protein
MKKLITVLAFSAALSAPAWAATQTVTLSVTGMTCAACPITIKKALNKVEGVENAVGISGAAFAALCCVAPFIVTGLVTAFGLGFILNDALLVGLLVVFIGVAALGYYFVRRQTCA